MASSCSLRAGLFLLLALLTQASAQAQATQYNDYVQAATLARAQGKILLVYFYSSALSHPTRLDDLFIEAGLEDTVSEQFILVSIDLESEPGHALAEAFYSRSRFDEGAQRNAVLVVERSVSSRGFSVLGRVPDQIDTTRWKEFVTKVQDG